MPLPFVEPFRKRNDKEIENFVECHGQKCWNNYPNQILPKERANAWTNKSYRCQLKTGQKEIKQIELVNYLQQDGQFVANAFKGSSRITATYTNCGANV